ncbi:MAG: hypothetical protein OEZ34_11745 [Spirochaetia bacterium]|nr:hypothetical protein [Spirochaetia bacterium]
MKIKHSLSIEKGIIVILFLTGIFCIFQAVSASEKIYMTGYLGMAEIFFSVSGLVIGFIKMVFSSAEISSRGVTFKLKNQHSYFLSAGKLVKANIRYNRRHVVYFLKEDGGYVDLISFLSRKRSMRYLEAMNWSPDRNTESSSENHFSEDALFKTSEDGSSLFYWRDRFSFLNNMSWSGLFSGIILLTGGVFAGNSQTGLQFLVIAALVPWMIFIFSRIRRRNSNPALWFGSENFFYGKETSGNFVQIRGLERKKIRFFRFNYDITTSVQNLEVICEDESARISLPGLNLCDGLHLAEKLNEIILKEKTL